MMVKWKVINDDYYYDYDNGIDDDCDYGSYDYYDS